jgi:hypothetical protein
MCVVQYAINECVTVNHDTAQLDLPAPAGEHAARTSLTPGWRTWATRTAFVVSGLILLSAAALKLLGWNVSPFAQYGWLLSPAVQVSAVIWEVLLGFWLLATVVKATTGRNATLPWLFTVLTFLAFAIVSGYLGYIGQANCGCFGLIQASPWTAFGLDVTILGLLALGIPGRVRHTEFSGSSSFGTQLKWLGAVAVFLVATTGVGTLVFGSLDVAVAKLRGESLGTDPTVLDFGTGKSGELLSTKVTVRNYTGKPVRLIGGTSDCSCLTTQDMPITIEPGSSANIAVKLKVPAANRGQMNRWIELFTDCPQQRTVRLTAGCVVTE